MRGDQLSRQWGILRQIEVSRIGLTAAEIAEAGGVSLRTAYRDLDDLQLSGFPLYTEKGEKGRRWRFVDAYAFKVPPPFSFTELLALHTSKDLFKVLKGTIFFESLESLIDKVRSALPPEALAYLDRIQSTFHTSIRPYKDYGRFKDIINKVNQAAMDRRRIEILYRPLKQKKEDTRKVDPYKIWFYEGTIYVIGLCHLRNQIRMFAVDRIRLLTLTEEKFDLPPDFDLESYTRDSFQVMQDELHTVKIRISPEWARYIGEEVWHESQATSKNPDKSLELTFRVAGLDEIKLWVMGLGAEAYVLEPDRLKYLVRDGLQNALVQYERVRPAYSQSDIREQQAEIIH